ncbi:MAG: 50S ribosomal protein L11 methyltransferase [Tissierellia bacterium]|nr:50S ribosomal protein L11 methyltransferase [Tissierellia bacterium]
MEYIEVSIRADRSLEDIIVDKLYEYEIDGINIEDDNLIFDMASNPTWEVVDFPERSMSNKINIITFFEREDYFKFIRNEIIEYIDEMKKIGNDLEIEREKPLDNTDWANEWKKYFKVLKIGENIVIKPTWEEYDKNDDDILIEIDPGMSFGTGTHATTSMCLEMLQEISLIGKNVLDIGCGSGILSIASAGLNANSVTAIDIDPVCIETTKRNAELNHCLDKIEVRQMDLTDGLNSKYDIVVVNIIAEIIVELLKELPYYLNKSALVILSGILEEKKEMVQSAIIDAGLDLVKTKNDSGWICMLVENKNA